MKGRQYAAIAGIHILLCFLCFRSRCNVGVQCLSMVVCNMCVHHSNDADTYKQHKCKKTIATIIGCISGTVIAALGTAIMSEVLGLTGYVDEHSYYLTLLNTETPIDLTAIIFAAITIGAVGAIMDVAMDLSSSLYELSEQVPDMTFGKLCKSGFSIGRDIMGTMANTLVLAYIGKLTFMYYDSAYIYGFFSGSSQQRGNSGGASSGSCGKPCHTPYCTVYHRNLRYSVYRT